MPDTRKARGPHPDDSCIFGSDQIGRLQDATRDLSWLLTRGYTVKSSLKLVGDRFDLTTRQRQSVSRSACSDLHLDSRLRREISNVRGTLCIDAFNIITTLEVALSGGVLIKARDGCIRDMASLHGNYRLIPETLPALGILFHWFDQHQITDVHWYLDSPISNSKRLAGEIRKLAGGFGVSHQIDVVPDPDPILKEISGTVASADSAILDQCDQWFNLANEILVWAKVESLLPGKLWMVDLSQVR